MGMKSIQKSSLGAGLIVRPELAAIRREIKNVNGHLTLGIDQRNLDVAFFVGQRRADL